MSFGEKGGVLSQQKASIIELNVSNRGQNKGLLDYLGGVLYHSIFLRCRDKSNLQEPTDAVRRN